MDGGLGLGMGIDRCLQEWGLHVRVIVLLTVSAHDVSFELRSANSPSVFFVFFVFFGDFQVFYYFFITLALIRTFTTRLRDGTAYKTAWVPRWMDGRFSLFLLL